MRHKLIEKIKKHCECVVLEGFEIETDLSNIPPGTIVIYPNQKIYQADLSKINLSYVDFDCDCFIATDDPDMFIQLSDFDIIDVNDLEANYQEDEFYFLIVKDLSLDIAVPQPVYKSTLPFTPGEKVYIAQRIVSEPGWDNMWVDAMNLFVNDGKQYIVENVNSKGIRLSDTSYSWPPSSLRRIGEKDIRPPTIKPIPFL